MTDHTNGGPVRTSVTPPGIRSYSRQYNQQPIAQRPSPHRPLVTLATLPWILMALLGIAVIVAVAAGWIPL